MGLVAAAYKAMYEEGRGSQKIVRQFVASMLVCLFAGGAGMLFLAERLRLIPTQEGVDEKERPPSIL